MTASTPSLRLRLLFLILVPLILISVLAGYWRYSAASKTSEEIFDRTLVTLTLAVSRDVAVSGGDALSSATRDLMREAAEAEFFYHVHGPDGVYLTGYAYPPRRPADVETQLGVPELFDADYRGEQVRVSRLAELTSLEGITGRSTVTVWQRKDERRAFTRKLALRAGILMGTLVLTVAAVVWFGIKLGLKPLDELQEAVSRRTSDDLSTIRRQVPQEVKGLVASLNALFGQVSDSIASRDRFISDAAHQLRNPIAGLLSLAEAAAAAKNTDDAKIRTAELADAARRASRLAQQLLSYERIRASSSERGFETADLNQLVEAVCVRNAERILGKGLEFSFEESPDPLAMQSNPVLLSEALENLIDNALVHAGPGNKGIVVSLRRDGTSAVATVRDFGKGIPPQNQAHVFERFAQAGPGEGSGLGLSIVKEIARLHGGEVQFGSADGSTGLAVELILPMG